MNKTELIKEVSKQSKLTQRDCMLCLNVLKNVMTSSLKRGEMITLSGFGKFFIKHYPPRMSYNPREQEICALGERYLPIFKASNVFKEKI